MFGRISRTAANKDKRGPQGQGHVQAQEAPRARAPQGHIATQMVDDDYYYDSPQRASSLIGGSGGVSLDGESLIVPDIENNDNDNDNDTNYSKYEGGDDQGTVSSMNTSTYGGMVKNDFKILGEVEHDYDSSQMSTGMDTYADNTIPPQEPPPLSNKQRAAQQQHYNYSLKQYPPQGAGAGAGGTPPPRGSAAAGASPDSRTRTSQSKNSRDHSRDDSDKDKEKGGGAYCIPLWIIEAPVWLKLVIVLSTALLVGAIVLIGVGATLAVQQDDSVQSSTTTQDGSDTNPTAPTFTSPTIPSITIAPAMSPNTDEGDDPIDTGTDDTTTTPGPTPRPTPSPTPVPPTMAPVSQSPTVLGETRTPTILPSSQPTLNPTGPPPVTFLVTAGRFIGNNLAQLPDQLQSLPTLDGNTVMFHLGDWNSPTATSCIESSYQSNQALFSMSAVPMYFVLGDNEYNGK
jgi:hypothetical protein